MAGKIHRPGNDARLAGYNQRILCQRHSADSSDPTRSLWRLLFPTVRLLLRWSICCPLDAILPYDFYSTSFSPSPLGALCRPQTYYKDSKSCATRVNFTRKPSPALNKIYFLTGFLPPPYLLISVILTDER